MTAKEPHIKIALGLPGWRRELLAAEGTVGFAQ